MAAQQEIARRFKTLVENPPPSAQKLPSGQSVVEDFKATRYRTRVENGKIDFLIFDPTSVGMEEGPMGLTVPSHGIEIFTFVPGSEIKEQTFFGLKKDNEIVRSHLVWMRQPAFPIKDVLNHRQSEALLQYVEAPGENEEKLVIARELPQQQQTALNERLVEETVLDRKVDAELKELAEQLSVVRNNPQRFIVD